MVLANDFFYERIKLDTINERFNKVPTAKEGDSNGRGMIVVLTENGLVKNTTGVELLLKWEHTRVAGAQGLEPFEALDLTKGEYIVTYPAEMNHEGFVKAEIRIIDNGKYAGSRNMKIQVEPSVGDDAAIESSNQFTALVTALLQVNSWNTTIDGKVVEWEADMAATKQLYIDTLNDVESTYPQELVSVKQQLEQKRDIAVKIKGTELDTSADANKVKLLNLSEEVQAAMAGTAPVISTVADGSLTKEKYADNSVSLTKTEKAIRDTVRPLNVALPFKKFLEYSLNFSERLIDLDIYKSLKGTTTKATFTDNKITTNGVTGQVAIVRYTINDIMRRWGAISFACSVAISNGINPSYSVWFFDINNTFISYKYGVLSGGVYKFENTPIPSNAAYFEVIISAESGSIAEFSNPILTYGAILGEYDESYYTKILAANTWDSIRNKPAFTWDYITGKPVQDLNFVLPPYIPCVVGKTVQIYLDNVLQFGNYYKAQQYIMRPFDKNLIEGAWAYSPTALSVDEVVNPSWYEGNKLILQGAVTMKPVPANAGSGLTKKCLFIGDSTTDMGTYTQEFLTLFDTDVMNVELLGTRGTAPNLHEGRGGWDTSDYALRGTRSGTVNPFWNTGTSLFDFAYYMSQQGYAGVDYVYINLGINDTGNSIATSVTVANINIMIASIKAYNPNIKIAVGLATNPTRFLNVWNGSGLNKDVRLELTKALIAAFKNKETTDKVFLIPNYTNVDPYWDFNYVEQAISTRNSKTTFVCLDGTHPAVAGYGKMADTTFSVTKYMASLG